MPRPRSRFKPIVRRAVLPPIAEAVAMARELGEDLPDLGDDGLPYLLRLLVSELVTGVVERSDGATRLGVELRVAPAGARVTVGADAARLRTPDGEGGGLLGGRSLEVVDQIADRWSVSREQGVIATAEVDLPRRPAAAR